MLPTFHQFGGYDAHGTIVGGKGLVQLGHNSTNGRGFFHQVDKKTGICQVQSRLDSGNSTACYHNRAYHTVSGTGLFSAHLQHSCKIFFLAEGY